MISPFDEDDFVSFPGTYFVNRKSQILNGKNLSDLKMAAILSFLVS